MRSDTVIVVHSTTLLVVTIKFDFPTESKPSLYDKEIAIYAPTPSVTDSFYKVFSIVIVQIKSTFYCMMYLRLELCVLQSTLR